MNVRRILGSAVVLGAVVTLVAGVREASARVTLHEGYVTETFAPEGFTDGPDGPYQTCADKIIGRLGFQYGGNPDNYVPPSPLVSRGDVTYRIFRDDQLVGARKKRFQDGASGYVKDDPVLGEVVVPPIVEVKSPPVMSLPAIEIWGASPSQYVIAAATDLEIPLPPGLAAGTTLQVQPYFSSIPRTMIVVDCPPPSITARMDILPGFATNYLVPKSPVPIPVDIFGSKDFDASTVTDLRLGAASPVVWPRRLAALDIRRDLNGDGFLDRRAWFVPKQTMVKCADRTLTLTARSATGAPVTAVNPVRPILCR